METIYVLKLRDSCWYVGCTTDLNRRWEEHRSGNGAEWTKLHHPVSLHHDETKEVPQEYAAGEESKVTAKLMLQHGVNFVRGGALCKMRMFTHSDMELLTSHIAHPLGMAFADVEEAISFEEPNSSEGGDANTRDVCLQCGRKGHWASECHVRNWQHGSDGEGDDRCFKRARISEAAFAQACARCGRTNHSQSQCFAKWHVDGSQLSDIIVIEDDSDGSYEDEEESDEEEEDEDGDERGGYAEDESDGSLLYDEDDNDDDDDEGSFEDEDLSGHDWDDRF
jgi:predicted GIY-YIG superfamily endonuclease